MRLVPFCILPQTACRFNRRKKEQTQRVCSFVSKNEFALRLAGGCGDGLTVRIHFKARFCFLAGVYRITNGCKFQHSLVEIAIRASEQSKSPLQSDAELFFVSVLILFLELALIRWIGTEIRIFAYLAT